MAAPVIAEEPETGWDAELSLTADGVYTARGLIDDGFSAPALADLRISWVSANYTFHANAYAPTGTSPSGRQMGDFSVLSNIDTGGLDPRLAEFWLERRMANASLRAGMLALDAEFWGSEYGAMFLNSAFGAPSIVSANLPNPAIFPTAAFGIRGEWQLSEQGTLRAALVDGDAGDPESDNRHGVRVQLDEDEGYLAALEYAWAPAGDAESGLFKVGAYAHSGKSFFDRDGNAARGTWGAYGVVDYPISETVGWFARAGFSKRDHSEVPWSLETGLIFANALGEGADLGLGLAQVDIDGDLSAETIVEATAVIPTGLPIELQPSLQYIRQKSRDGENNDGLAIGVRAAVSF
jgi:carbohydrate-selective porin OprB